MVLYKQSKVSERNLKVFLSQILHKSSTFVSKEKGQISMKARMQAFLRRFSFRTGVIVLVLCVPCYIISFAQMALPICVELKGGLWFIFFGLAKSFQYGGLTIIGVDGVKRLKAYIRNKR